jgi:hypothetical protein
MYIRSKINGNLVSTKLELGTVVQQKINENSNSSIINNCSQPLSMYYCMYEVL